MRRSPFLALVGLSVDQHRGMVRKGVLPFLEAEEGWSDYTLRQVFLTALSITLAEMTTGQADAADRAAELPNEGFTAIRAVFDEPCPRLWGASFRDRNGRPRWLIGDRETILLPTELGEVLAGDVSSVLLIDLVQVAAKIRERGRAAGVNVDLVGGL